MKRGEAPDKVPKKDVQLEKKMLEEKAKRILELQKKKTVHETICLLTETVGVQEFKTALNVLDVCSWDEVLEERFIGRTCGWPLCSQPLDVAIRNQRYKLDKKNQKVYEAYADKEKFCSPTCHNHHFHVRGQLHELPLWFTGVRQEKEYDLFAPESSSFRGKQDKKEKEDSTSDDPPKLGGPGGDSIEIISDKLLCQLNSLHIAENAADASSGEEQDDEETTKLKQKGDDREFMTGITSYLSGPQKAHESSVLMKETKPKVKMTEQVMEEKLEKLRSKYSPGGTHRKKAIIIVEPHQLRPGEANL